MRALGMINALRSSGMSHAVVAKLEISLASVFMILPGAPVGQLYVGADLHIDS